MKKNNQTAINEFIVVKPKNGYERKGEVLELSHFGEYCPTDSLRGYCLSYLLKHPINYKVKSVIEKGKKYDV